MSDETRRKLVKSQVSGLSLTKKHSSSLTRYLVVERVMEEEVMERRRDK